MKVLRNGKAVEKVDPPAVDISSEAVAEWIAHFRTHEWPEEGTQPSRGQLVDLLEALAADRDRLRALPPPDPPPDSRDALIGTDVSDAAIADATIARLSADLEAAREALDPFAAYAEWLSHLSDESNVLSFHRGRGRLDWLHLIAGDFRRARAVRANLSKGA